MVIAALAVDLVFSAAGLMPETRPSIESITDRGITLNYTAVLNILFTLASRGAGLTIRRGAKDPVCRMRVDPDATPHHSEFEGHTPTSSAQPAAKRSSRRSRLTMRATLTAPAATGRAWCCDRARDGVR